MAPGEHLGARVRRALHLVVVIAAAMVVGAPLLLGPASGALIRALGGADEHHCACGMTPGTCGCAECARIEHERREAKRTQTSPVIRSSCDDGPMLRGSTALPATVVRVLVTRAPIPRGERTPTLTDSTRDPSRARSEPPTPPPRALA